jgi:nucleoside-diphosphate-sugar epimerase
MLLTGASSPIAANVLQRLLVDFDAEVWCSRHRNDVRISHPGVHTIDLDLESEMSVNSLRMPFDVVIHFAGLTHSLDEQKYWKINLEGALRLAKIVRAQGCRRFVYISTRCASPGSGAYGESKLAAEKELQKMDWKSLLVIRPAEIYGSEGHEGIDRMLEMACRLRIVPALWGHPNLNFAPIHIDDFSVFAAELIRRHEEGVRIENVCGPENLSGVKLAWRISKRYRAVPLPLWWPGVAVCLKVLHRAGIPIVKPDQLKRLVVKKTGTAEKSQTAPVPMTRFLLS